MCSPVKDIVALRLSHCRAERAAKQGQFHLAALHYRSCLEAAERREDLQAVHFFALRLAGCYEHMALPAKAASFYDLALHAAAHRTPQSARRPDPDGTAAASLL